MCRVIVIANQKGGIGKTTTAVSLATTLESIGKRTLLIDCDPQCNSTDVYGAEMNGVTTLYDLIIEQNVEDPMEAVQKTSVGEIVAGDHLLVKSEVVFLQDPVEGIYRLQKISHYQNSKNVQSTLMSMKWDMFCIIQINVRLMRNMFRL